MHKIIWAGGPSTGKSTMYREMRQRRPEDYYLPEPATLVIEEELARQSADPDYTPILPLTHYGLFLPKVIDKSLQLEATIPEGEGISWQDRSLIDNLGYLDFNRRRHNTEYGHEERIRRCVRAAGYTLAFFCDWLGKVEQNETRRETYDEGLAIHQSLERAYHDSGIPVVHLPAVPVAERLNIVESEIARL